MADKAKKKQEIKELLPNSELIAKSPYSVDQWEAILHVLPDKHLDELYGFLILENKKNN
jgi:hypothetical protein